MPSTVPAIYDGQRRGKHMLILRPGSTWGERAYGLNAEEDFRFEPAQPSKGDQVKAVLADATYLRLVRQRDLRRRKRRPRRR